MLRRKILNFLGIVNLISASLGETMDIIRIVCVALMALCGLAIIVLVMFQPSASENMGALTGQSYDSFYSKNKVRTPEGIMKRLTVVLSIVLAIVVIAFFVTGFFYDF